MLYTGIPWQWLSLDLGFGFGFGFGFGQTCRCELERWQTAGAFDRLHPMLHRK
ncbi:hypothetical protein [Streptomyces sp. NPDC088847]|uniref:hypothetical protein n=1 Tax=Streptomyces sp. NPDC088847 TaxID=3365909 RepID=UPI00381941EA